MNKNLSFSVQNLSKSFVIPCENRNTIRERLLHFNKKISTEKFKVLDNISFDVKKGEFFSIIGRNGSGKSTLLKILAGIYTPDEGRITVNGEISPFLELGVGFNPDLSGKDNIYLNSTILGLSKKDIDRKYKSIVEFSELEHFIHLKLKNYSSGMQVRLAFATAVQSNREILIMDEVLAVGDANFQMKCFAVFEKIIKSGRTIIFVSHDTNSVQKYSNRVLYLESGKIACLGSANEALSKYMHSNILKESQSSSEHEKALFTERGLADNYEGSVWKKSDEPDANTSGKTEEEALEIQQALFFDSDNQLTEILPYGCSFKIKLRFKSTILLSDLIFKLIINNNSDQTLFSSDSRAENFKCGAIQPGNFAISYEMQNYFHQGIYSLSVSVSDSSGRLFYIF